MSRLWSIIDIQGPDTTIGQRHTTRVPPCSLSVRSNRRYSQVWRAMFSRPYSYRPVGVDLARDGALDDVIPPSHHRLMMGAMHRLLDGDGLRICHASLLCDGSGGLPRRES